MTGVTITPVNGNTQLYGVRVSNLQTGITVNGLEITGTVHNFVHDPDTQPDAATLDGYHLIVDITPAEGESISGIPVTGPTARPVRGEAGGHIRVYLAPGQTEYLEVTSTDGSDTLTQRFILNLTYDT